MTNAITILAISTVILSVTFIPLAEASVGWNGFLREIGFGGPQVYEVSAVSLVPVVGGEIIPIESTSLLLAGAQSFSWMIPVVLSVLGIGLFVVSRKSE